MEKVTLVWLSTFADLLVNLSAGWFGAAFIVPLASRKPKLRLWVLIINVVFGILALVVAVLIRNSLSI